MIPRRTTAGVLALLTFGSIANADWPMARHDPKRTGAAVGHSDITLPAAYWRYYLGGRIASQNLAEADLSGNGDYGVLAVTGGRALAKRISDETVWKTPPLGLSELTGIADLDGDGTLEVVVRSRNRAYVLALATGDILWKEPAGEMGTIGGTLLVDTTGDGLPELIVAECVCCGVRTDLPGVAYSFAAGVNTPQRIWELPVSSCGAAGYSLGAADVRGDAAKEIVIGTEDRIVLVDGRSGSVIAQSPSLGAWIMRSYCAGIDIDGSPGDELACILDTSLPPNTNQHRVFVLRYTAQPQPVLNIVWDRSVAPDDGGSLSFVDPVVDLDGNGTAELIFSTRVAPSAPWTLKILDLASGNTLASIPGQKAQGAYRSSPAAAGMLITTDDTSLRAWRFDPMGPTAVVEAFHIDDATPLQYTDRNDQRSRGMRGRILAVNVAGDGNDELIARRLTSAAHLAAIAADGTIVGDFDLPVTRDVRGAWPGIGALGRLALLQDDGRLLLLDYGLQPLVAEDDVVATSLRFGGYYVEGGWRQLRETVATGRLDTTGDAVVATNSRGAIVRIDSSSASWGVAPLVRWTKEHAFSPLILPETQTSPPSVACFAMQEPPTNTPRYLVEKLDDNGISIWAVSTPTAPLNDLVPARLGASNEAALVYQWGEPTGRLTQVRALSRATGALLWQSSPVDAGDQGHSPGFAVGDFDRDGTDDIYYQTRGTRVVSGLDGAEIAALPGASYFQPILADIDADQRDEVILQGGSTPVSVLEDDLGTVLWKSADQDQPFPYGALADCAGGEQVFVEGSLEHPARLKVTSLDGAQGLGQTRTTVLAGGARYQDEQRAENAGKVLGQLTSAASHPDLQGDGRALVVVGSSDGWLYAYDPCADRLAFTYYAGAPVGSPVFGDTDGDGRDEILISVADGYLYALKNLDIASPSWVMDIDPSRGIFDHDVNRVFQTAELSARWRDVPGAVSYQVAVVTADGKFADAVGWRDVGLVVQVSIDGLQLEEGATYRVAVRAVGPSGVSVDAVSDGVVVRVDSTDAGPGGAGTSDAPRGCGCASTRSDPSSFAMLLALVLISLAGSYVVGPAQQRPRRKKPNA